MYSSGIFCKVVLTLIFAAISTCAAAQQSGTGGSGETTTPTPQRKNSPVPEPLGNLPPPSTNNIKLPRPDLVFITGEVVLEDGTPPPFGAVIERDCGGTVIKETSIDVSGHFTFRVGDQSRMSHILPDASQSIGEELASQNMTDANGEYVSPASIGEAISLVAMTQIFGCALRAELPGYESTSVILGGGSRTGLIQAGTIVLRPRTRVKGRIISAANLLAGKAARKELEAAKKAMEKNELSEAEASAKRAIAIYPKYADAWLVQGDLNELQNRNQEAREAYSKAIEIDNLFLGPYIGLAKLSAREKKWKDVAELTDKALALDPINMPDGHFLNALAYYNMNQLDLAEKSALRGRRLDLENRVPAINLILANVLLRKKDYAAAVDAMKAYLNAAPNAPDAAAVRARIQENEKLAKAK